MAFVDVSTDRQREINARQRAFESQIANSFVEGGDESRRNKREDALRAAGLAREDQLRNEQRMIQQQEQDYARNMELAKFGISPGAPVVRDTLGQEVAGPPTDRQYSQSSIFDRIAQERKTERDIEKQDKQFERKVKDTQFNEEYVKPINETRKYQLAQQQAELDMQKDFVKNQNRGISEDTREKRRLLNEEKLMKRTVPGVGVARTDTDAKILKEASETKDSFDRKLEELIQLRKDYGTEYFNREAVARGQQLSKSLLLDYKNMARLGILSQSDQDIVEAIIPADPLKQDGVPFQDPVLSNLSKLKEDIGKDYSARVKVRTVSDMPEQQASNPLTDKVLNMSPEERAQRKIELEQKYLESQGKAAQR